MAGLDDYQFYKNLREKESPFWQKSQESSRDLEMMGSPLKRPTEFPQKLQGTPQVTPRQYDIEEYSSNKDVNLEKYGEASINIISVCAENLLSHPFIVLRRQCQVNVNSRRYHLLPVTLAPAILHLQSSQGMSVFWKGLGSVFIIRGVTLGLEDCISKFTPWPKEVSPHSSLKMLGQHLMLKCCAIALITPFYSASLVETVQSEIASERPGVFDVFKEGLLRLLSFTQPQTGRMLPVWLLVGPTVLYGVTQYLICRVVTTATSNVLRDKTKKDQRKQGAVSKENGSLIDASARLQAVFLGHMVTDIILYPMETILHRLHLQGTRTIIDSLDAGYEVKPILTRYEGFFDCLSTSVKEEGIFGLFKGFGALCIQYALYGTVLKFAHIIIREVTMILVPPKPKPKPREPQDDVTQPFDDLVKPLAPSAPYTNISSVHGGIASLHSTPHQSPRQQYNISNIADEVDLAQYQGMNASAATRLRLKDLDMKAEVEKYKAKLDNE